MEARFETIETKLAYHEQALSELSDLVYAQQAQIDRLREMCSLLRQRIDALRETPSATGLDDERPPHY